MEYTYPIYKPYLTKKNLSYAHDALDSTWISSQGKYLNMATEKLKETTDSRYALLTNNGTSAMQLVSLIAATLCNGDNFRIAVPDNVYVAAWNVFFSIGFDAKIFFPVSSDINTWNFDYGALDKVIEENNINSILVVDNLGNPVNVSYLRNRYPNLVVVEDACESFGAKINGKPCGTDVVCSALSFFANKSVTSGEGGAFLTQREDIYNLAKRVHGQGMSEKKYIHDTIGYNFRMTNIQAAILYGQLEDYPEIIERKINNFALLKNRIGSKASNILFQEVEYDAVPSYWMYGVRIVGAGSYEKTKEFFDEKGIETRPLFYPMNYHKHYSKLVWDYSNSALLSREVIMLPSYPALLKKDINYIGDCVVEYAKTLE